MTGDGQELFSCVQRSSLTLRLQGAFDYPLNPAVAVVAVGQVDGTTLTSKTGISVV